jgi:hypothetical protein
MATWRTGTGIEDCPHCGAQHSFTYQDLPVREKGSQACLKCGKELMSWNGARDYSGFKLVKRQRK